VNRPRFNPIPMLEVLQRHGVEFIVVGAAAAIVQGSPIPTYDLEVTPARYPENYERLANALRELSAELRTPVDPVPFPIDAKMLAGGEAWTLATTFGELDLVFAPAGTRGFEDLRRDAFSAELGTGRPALVASLRDVIRMREASNREKDRGQLPALRRTLELIREREAREQRGR
jgi:hypothetical protein